MKIADHPPARLARRLTAITLVTVTLALGGCASNSDEFCSDITLCRGLSVDQNRSCQQEQVQVRAEATASGCATLYDEYISCSISKYDCTGNVPSFKGCDGQRASLDGCLSVGRAHNSCGRLEAALQACPAAAPPPLTPAPCGSAEVCASGCYLDSVGNPCAPTPAELANAERCAQLCP